jgi:ATP-dependent Clp protease ATP-binding subunit ClpA
MSGRFDKFTERARRTLQLAQEEAQHFNHNYIGTEHILLGLVREGDGVAARVLNNLGIDLGSVRSSVEFIIGRGERMVMGEIGLTPRAKRVIEFAVDEARRLNHHYIGTEHLLLGLVREGEGIAAGVLESLGVSLEKVRAQVIEVLKSSTENAPSSLTEKAEQQISTSFGTDLARALWRYRRHRARYLRHQPEDLSEYMTVLSPWVLMEFPTTSLEQLDSSFLDALRGAVNDAQRYDRDYIGAGNLLVAMLRKEDSAVRRLLNQHGGDLILELDSKRDDLGANALTPETHAAIEHAIREALAAGVKATEAHLLLGIMLEDNSTAYQALAREGITADEVRALIKGDTAGSSE